MFPIFWRKQAASPTEKIRASPFAIAVARIYLPRLMSESKKVILAIIGSALLHFLIVVLFFLFSLMLPRIVVQASIPKTNKPLEVNLRTRPKPVATPVPVATTKAQPVVPTATATPPRDRALGTTLSSYGLTQSAAAPENPQFEADINSVAASEKPGEGDPNLPNQEGKERKARQFENKAMIVGQATPKPVAPVATPEPTPMGVTVVSTPTPAPGFNPTPVKERDLADKGKPKPKPSSTPDRKELALNRASPTPKPAATPATKALTSPELRSFVPMTEKTKVQGGAKTPGSAGVNAVATPRGRYQKLVYDAVGARWSYYVAQRQDLMMVGETAIEFYVTGQGRVENARVISNTANETFASYCLLSVTESTMPPIPDELAAALPDRRMRINFTFNLYPQ